MPGIVALVALISLDVTSALVAANYTAPFAGPAAAVLTITGASNASPIVVSTAEAHGVPAVGSHVVISGALGNTAVNNLDADGVTHNAWLAVPASTHSLSLYTIDSTTGALVPSVGNGAWTSGGTVSQALTDGRVLLGRQHIFEQSSPPRIVFVPKSSAFSGKDVYSRSTSGASVEQTRQSAQRALATDAKTFEVHVWGAATPADPDGDFDATEVLYQQVIRSVHLLLPGSRSFGGGTWADQTEAGSQLISAGHWFVFTVEIATPVLGALLPRAPSDVTASPTTKLDPNDGSPLETGCAG